MRTYVRVCSTCGARFESENKMDYRCLECLIKFCDYQQTVMLGSEYRAERLRKKRLREERAKRLAARDAAYAAAFPNLVTIEKRPDGTIVEYRGRRCIASRH